MAGERGAAPSIGRHGRLSLFCSFNLFCFSSRSRHVEGSVFCRCYSDEEKLLLQEDLLPSYPHLGLPEEAKQWDSHVMKGCKGDMSIDCLRFFFDHRSFSHDADDRIP
ncbi:hypothetical protein VPH35_066768 [Triticum aestivum]